MRKYLIAGNWKMNTTISETKELINSLKNGLEKIGNVPATILVCPPFVNIPTVKELTQNTQIKVGAQNCHFEKKGAFTGEVSVAMLQSVGCDYIIIGHSERRSLFGETNEFINKKLKTILESGITPIVCIGETLEERKSEATFTVLKEQLEGSLADINNADIDKIVIAYEPVWAIGTGVAATAKEIAVAHNWLREFLVNKYGSNAKNIYLLYGGSLSDANAEETLGIEDVNGGLIGGASLVTEKFLSIIKTANNFIENPPNNNQCCCCGN